MEILDKESRITNDPTHPPKEVQLAILQDLDTYRSSNAVGDGWIDKFKIVLKHFNFNDMGANGKIRLTRKSYHLTDEDLTQAEISMKNCVGDVRILKNENYEIVFVANSFLNNLKMEAQFTVRCLYREKNK